MAAEQLPLFEKRQVKKATMRITNAGDGLSEALELEPVALKLGQPVCFVIRGAVTQVNHREKDDEVERQHTVKVSDIAQVDQETADRIITAEQERLSRLRDEMSGQQRIEDDGTVDLESARKARAAEAK